MSMRLFAAISWTISCASFAAQPYPNTSNFGVPFSEDEPWYQQCMRVADLGEREITSPGPAAATCKAGELYYTKRNQAATTQGEWNSVRSCAVAHADNSVLMMLYANGFGVPRDTDMALHYACKLDFIAKSEMEVRVQHLTSAKPGDIFDQCDDITSGYMGGVCAAIREDQNKHVRDVRMERLAAKLAPAARAAFVRLRMAAERYAAEATGEVDRQGTAASDQALQYQAKLREQFMRAAIDTVGGKLPSASNTAFNMQDAKLNKAFRAVMAVPSTQDGWPDRIGTSTIDHTSVRHTQRRWLAYRDAFVGFASTLPSAPDLSAVKMLLAGQRIAQLERIAR